MSAVTVVITTYNLEKYISQCLNELLDQTMRDFSILIVDDHSSDATAEIVRNYIASYPDRIQAMFLPDNLGSSSRTRNVVLDSGMITSEYVVFLDGDDRVEPTFLECLYATARTLDADIAVCSFDRIGIAKGHTLCAELQWLPDGKALEGGDPALAFLNGALWNKMIRVKTIGNERIPDLKVGEDAAFALRLYNRCNRIACVRQNLIHYQVRPGSAIAGTSLEAIRRFADELARQFHRAPENKRLVLLMASYLHIVLSMLLRAAEHKDINLAAQYRWTRDYCTKEFQNFEEINPVLFCRYAGSIFKGAAIRVSFFCYRHGLLLPALKAMRMYTRITRQDIKW